MLNPRVSDNWRFNCTGFYVANNCTYLLGGGYSLETITQPTCCSTGGF